MNARRAGGFSLLEVLVAVAIFALIAGAAFAGIEALIGARERVTQATERLRALDLALGGMVRDLGHALARPARGAGGAPLPALAGGTQGFELSHMGFAALANPAAGRVRRTAWALDQQALTRIRWPSVDRADFGARPEPERLVDEIEGLRLRYLDRSGQWRREWPPREGPDARLDALPIAVEIELESRQLGPLRRLVQLPQGGSQ